MNIIITGGEDLLGIALKENCGNNILWNPNKDEFDILNIERMENYFKYKRKIDTMIHCAVLKDITKDYLGTTLVSSICAELGIKMIYISTEEIFDNTYHYKEKYNEDDGAGPVTDFAKMKWYGEAIVNSYGHKILRVSKFSTGESVKEIARLIILCVEKLDKWPKRILHVGGGMLDTTLMKTLLGIK